jgi:two-component system, OmpR family, sensor histidine kinase KdpD
MSGKAGPMRDITIRAQLKRVKPVAYLLSVVGVGVMTLVIELCHAGNSLANVNMLYLLVVIVAAVQLGRAAAILASICSFFSLDYFFVQPLYTLTVADPTEWLALCVFLLVAIVTGELTARVRTRAQEALQHDLEMTTLAEASWEIASDLDSKRAMDYVLNKIASLLTLSAAAVIAHGEDGKLETISAHGVRDSAESLLTGQTLAAIDFVFQRALPLGPRATQYPNLISAGQAYQNAPDYKGLDATILPIYVEGSVAAVLYIKSDLAQPPNRRENQLLTALVNHVGLLLQRDKSLRAEAKAQALLEADQLKTALLSMVSHDFRSPLTSIKASIQTLKSAGNALALDEQENLLQAVDLEVDRLNRMVSNILDLSRLEAGAWRPKREQVPASELLGSMLDFFNQRDNQRINVHNELGENMVLLDSVQISQVLHNLLENALKYSPKDQAVDLHCRQFAQGLEFEVRDRGDGIAPEDKDTIFEPFSRGRSLSESNIPGVGIGLAICRGLVKAHGGTIEAESRDGGGSIFRVTLPQT